MLRLTQIVVKMLRAGGHHERADAVLRADAEANADSGGSRDEPVEDVGPALALPDSGGPSAAAHDDPGAGPHGGGAGGGGDGGASGADHSSSDAPDHAGAGGVGGGERGEHGGEHGGAHASEPGGEHGYEHGGEPPVAALGALTDDSTHGLHAPHDSHGELHADPLAGIRSARLRDSIQRDAFRTASSDAQDSEIRSAAERMLNLGLPFPPTPDLSPAAQQARIEALHGELPTWARGDARYDTAVEPAGIPRETAGETTVSSLASTQSVRSPERNFDR
jgi:hypothetical protein